VLISRRSRRSTSAAALLKTPARGGQKKVGQTQSPNMRPTPRRGHRSAGATPVPQNCQRARWRDRQQRVGTGTRRRLWTRPGAGQHSGKQSGRETHRRARAACSRPSCSRRRPVRACVRAGGRCARRAVLRRGHCLGALHLRGTKHACRQRSSALRAHRRALCMKKHVSRRAGRTWSASPGCRAVATGAGSPLDRGPEAPQTCCLDAACAARPVLTPSLRAR